MKLDVFTARLAEATATAPLDRPAIDRAIAELARLNNLGPLHVTVAETPSRAHRYVLRRARTGLTGQPDLLAAARANIASVNRLPTVTYTEHNLIDTPDWRLLTRAAATIRVRWLEFEWRRERQARQPGASALSRATVAAHRAVALHGIMLAPWLQAAVLAAQTGHTEPDALVRAQPVLDLALAGVFGIWITSDEVVCIPCPTAARGNDHHALHADHEPALMWTAGTCREQHYVWHGVRVPPWAVCRLQRGQLTAEAVAKASDLCDPFTFHAVMDMFVQRNGLEPLLTPDNHTVLATGRDGTKVVLVEIADDRAIFVQRPVQLADRVHIQAIDVSMHGLQAGWPDEIVAAAIEAALEAGVILPR